MIRPENSPAGGEVLLHQAVAEISAASGLRFVFDGPTAEGPNKERDKYQPERYGEHWVPVLLTWSDPEETPGLAGMWAAWVAATTPTLSGIPSSTWPDK